MTERRMIGGDTDHGQSRYRRRCSSGSIGTRGDGGHDSTIRHVAKRLDDMGAPATSDELTTTLDGTRMGRSSPDVNRFCDAP